MARKFRKVTAEQYTFKNAGDAVEGTLVNKEIVIFENEGRETPVGKYTLETEDGNRISFLGSTTLDSTMGIIDIGAYIRVTFKGTTPRKTGSGNVRLFDVEVAE